MYPDTVVTIRYMIIMIHYITTKQEGIAMEWFISITNMILKLNICIIYVMKSLSLYTKCSSPRVLLMGSVPMGSEVCTADKPSWKHTCVCCVHHLEYNAKHCSAWIFLSNLFGKSLCIRTKKWKGEH